jgi:GT2 family glycosyltransferase
MPGLTSVVLVSYHTGPVLFQAIKSVLAQTAPVELCLVDNGNPPGAMAAIRSMALVDPRIRFISGHGNIGYSRGCNLGARAAQGEFILILNPDSMMPPDAVAGLKAHAAKLKSPFMIGARLLDEQGQDQRGCRRALLTPRTALIEALHLGRFFPSARLNYTLEPIPETLSPIPAISGAFMFLPREDYWNCGGFDEGYFLHVEDLDLCLRFRRQGGEIYFAPDIVVTHIGGTSDATSGFVEKHKARGFMRYFHKNFSEDYPAALLLALYAAVWCRAGVKTLSGMAKRRLRPQS